MDSLVWHRDRTLSAVSLAIGGLLWLAVIYVLVTRGGVTAIFSVAAIAIVVIAISLLVYLFIRSAVIAHMVGSGVEITASQHPDLHQQLAECCGKLDVTKAPRLFLMNGNGVFNAFATWFIGRKYIGLLSSVVDAMEGSASGARFYIGHELGHVLRHDNPLLWTLRWPALRLPLLGAAFSRARETTCDLHGAACCKSPDDAGKSLSALLAGSRRWQGTSGEALLVQAGTNRGFWGSFHELVAGYPWTINRVLRARGDDGKIPARNPFAYVLAAFVPYAGRQGAGIGVLVYIYFIGIMAAIAIPAYQDYVTRTILTQVANETMPVRNALAAAYLANHEVPRSLAAVGAPEALPDGTRLSLDSQQMVLTVTTARGALEFRPTQNQKGEIRWSCGASGTTRPAQLPLMCR